MTSMTTPMAAQKYVVVVICKLVVFVVVVKFLSAHIL